jgi:hypothetical protein
MQKNAVRKFPLLNLPVYAPVRTDEYQIRAALIAQLPTFTTSNGKWIHAFAGFTGRTASSSIAPAEKSEQLRRLGGINA